MMRRIPIVLAAAWLLASSAWAQELPPGYQGVIQITNDTAHNGDPSINNAGQIAFSKRIDPNKWQTSDIYLYDNGLLTRLTNDNVADDYPDINDAGEIVWSRAIGTGGTLEIVLWRTGQLTRLTYDNLDDGEADINNQGLIAWKKFTNQGCANADADIWLYDGQTIGRITEAGSSNQSPRLNDRGDLVWTRYNFCHWPWTSEIMLRFAAPGADPVAVALTGNQGEPQVPDINNARVVAWYSCEPPLWSHDILVWRKGVTTVLTDWGSALRMNDRGDVVFNRWHDDTKTWQVWLYKAGQFWQITNDAFWNCDGDINEHGDIAWQAGDGLDLDIKLLERFGAADLNCDGAVNLLDIDPFVLALTDRSAYASVYPRCDCLLADVNLDLDVNFLDIDPFVELLAP